MKNVLIMLLCAPVLYAQTMHIHLLSGTEETVKLDSIAKITFNEAAAEPVMKVAMVSGDADSAVLDSIGYISFNDQTTDLEVPRIKNPQGPGPVGLRVTPNPVFSTASIRVSLKQAGRVSAAVYAQNGSALVAYLSQDHLAAGTHSLKWDGKDMAGRQVPNGTYIVAVTGAAGNSTLKILVVR